MKTASLGSPLLPDDPIQDRCSHPELDTRSGAAEALELESAPGATRTPDTRFRNRRELSAVAAYWAIPPESRLLSCLAELLSQRLRGSLRRPGGLPWVWSPSLLPKGPWPLPGRSPFHSHERRSESGARAPVAGGPGAEVLSWSAIAPTSRAPEIVASRARRCLQSLHVAEGVIRQPTRGHDQAYLSPLPPPAARPTPSSRADIPRRC